MSERWGWTDLLVIAGATSEFVAGVPDRARDKLAAEVDLAAAGVLEIVVGAAQRVVAVAEEAVTEARVVEDDGGDHVSHPLAVLALAAAAGAKAAALSGKLPALDRLALPEPPAPPAESADVNTSSRGSPVLSINPAASSRACRSAMELKLISPKKGIPMPFLIPEIICQSMILILLRLCPGSILKLLFSEPPHQLY